MGDPVTTIGLTIGGVAVVNALSGAFQAYSAGEIAEEEFRHRIEEIKIQVEAQKDMHWDDIKAGVLQQVNNIASAEKQATWAITGNINQANAAAQLKTDMFNSAMEGEWGKLKAIGAEYKTQFEPHVRQYLAQVGKYQSEEYTRRMAQGDINQIMAQYGKGEERLGEMLAAKGLGGAAAEAAARGGMMAQMLGQTAQAGISARRWGQEMYTKGMGQIFPYMQQFATMGGWAGLGEAPSVSYTPAELPEMTPTEAIPHSELLAMLGGQAVPEETIAKPGFYSYTPEGQPGPTVVASGLPGEKEPTEALQNIFQTVI